jgi:uncharacterized protein (DUF1330 family)/uncharacterized protein YndB with AHSA1/START domain
MTTEPTPSPNAARLERTYDAPAELIWELWTTAAGLEEWFAPDGFDSQVSELELRPGGQLRYTMTATAPEQVAFMRNTGNPLSAEVRKTFTEVAPPTRLAYRSLIDFVPGHEPYEHLTTVDIEPAGDRTNVVMTVDPLHDETWTQQHRAHRGNELDNLEAAIRRRTADTQTRGGDRGDMSQQPVAYVISAVEGVVDESTVKRYAELTGPAIEHFGGRFIVSNTEPVVVEGESPSNYLSMVEFPSMEDAKAWYNSPEYAEARGLTPAAFRGRLLIFVEGGR